MIPHSRDLASGYPEPDRGCANAALACKNLDAGGSQESFGFDLGPGFWGYGHRVGHDDYSQPRALFQLMLRRMLPAGSRDHQTSRTLRDITNPKVRGAALWVAHSMMARVHIAASDRPPGTTPPERQTALLSRSPAIGRRWLSQRQADWPREYRRTPE